MKELHDDLPGSIDWRKKFEVAKVGGVKNHFVEMNLDLMKASVPYLQRR